MNNINQFINIIKISLSFDNALKVKKFDNLQQQNDILISHLKNFNLLKSNNNNINNINEQLIKLSTELYEINNEIISSIGNLSNNKIKKNTLILLYNDQCVASSQCMNEWNKLKLMNNGKIDMVAINCTKLKNMQLCEKFGTYIYPTIKYLYDDDKIDSYLGKIDADEIFKTYLKIE